MLTEQLIGYGLLVIGTFQLCHFWVLNYKQIYIDARGADMMWQMIEILGIHALVIWTVMMLGSSFFGFLPPPDAWNSINFILAASILGIIGKHINGKWLDYLSDKKKDKPVE